MTLHHGDCLAILPTLEACSVDAVVTDPPYELGFMGRAWDASGVAYRVEMWREVFRVLKPGGHLLAFGGSRTYHRMACAVEDAGFEIRDQIMWLYGSGFPKSLDVSKAIDKASRRDYVLAAIELGLSVPGNSLHDWTKAEHSPSDAWWERFKAVLSADDWQRIERKVLGRKAWQNSVHHFRPGADHTQRIQLSDTAPATDLARQWEGWGTALKPGHEPIVVARKPLSEPTVAANVARWGTGALNIDAGRLPVSVADSARMERANSPGSGRFIPGNGTIYGGGKGLPPPGRRYDTTAGRWPANVALSCELWCTDDEHSPTCAVAMLDRQSGFLQGRGNKGPSKGGGGMYGHGPCTNNFGSDAGGGASRFFYCAKASASERNAGLPDRCQHPTVKPIALMRWLCRLVTPPSGLILDPFLGSGTTGIAAALEGFQFVGIEQDAEYLETARQRIAHWSGGFVEAAG